jgi:hypothetical protein
MQTVQTGVFIGGCVDGMTYTLTFPERDRVFMVPPNASLQPPIQETSKTRPASPGDLYVLETLTVAECGIRLLFYRHEKLTAIEAFQLLFDHYGRKA